jgi:hypothetical protein
MSDGLISLFLGAGAAGWFYSQLAKRNGNADPKSNMLAAVVGGVVVAIVLFTILKFMLNM